MIQRVLKTIRIRLMPFDRPSADVLYILVPGVTELALKGIEWVIQSGLDIQRCLLISSPRDFGYNHAILIERSSASDVIVQGGLVSGHAGEGAKGLAKALALLDQHDVNVSHEAVVQSDTWSRLCKGSLTETDLTNLWETYGGDRPVPYYISDFPKILHQRDYWTNRPVIMPFALIDPDLQDLARDLLNAKSSNDSALVRGYRRLEETAKSKSACTAIRDPWGSIFGPDNGLLMWPNCPPDEVKGRMQLFQGVAGAFRNPRAHSENVDSTYELNEFLLLNFLFRLLKDAVVRREILNGPPQKVSD